ncbi:hypothetical protein HAX54_035729 [Datura stramonium]|uniref:Uncharacterized protein n=1 Tax=Datura stramonium TaxID=4076 RepID=A0ABS8VH83_DATST|nr:hypothetical protein [Datura stramonium]
MADFVADHNCIMYVNKWARTMISDREEDKGVAGVFVPETRGQTEEDRVCWVWGGEGLRRAEELQRALVVVSPEAARRWSLPETAAGRRRRREKEERERESSPAAIGIRGERGGRGMR